MSTEIYLNGNEETIKPIITLLMGINQMIADKDIGQFVGQTIEENVKAIPHSLRMKLIWYSRKEPPYVPPMGIKLVKAEYQIPDIDRKKLDWTYLKQVMGGDNGYIWGRFVATVKLDNGRQMQCYGATPKDAREQLDRMLTVTTAKPLTFGVTEIKNENRRAKGESMHIEKARVYPAFMVLVNSKRINRIEQKIRFEEKKSKIRSKLRGDYLEKGSERVKMWMDKPPANYKKILDSALRFDDDDD